MTASWDYYLGTDETTGYATGDVAETWDAHAAQSDAGLDNAADGIEANDAALHDAAAHMGTDPAGFDAAAADAVSSFEATFQNQLSSMGMGPGVEVAGANDPELGAGASDFSHYDSQVDGF